MTSLHSVSTHNGTHRLTDMVLDFVSLVPAGDDPLAKVVIAKADPTGIEQENNMADEISKSDLAPEVVAYIEGLETEVDTLNDQVAKSESDIEELSARLSKHAPDDDSTSAISKEALAAMEPSGRSVVEKQQAELAAVTEIAKAEREARIEREFVEKAAALPMLGDAKVLAPLLRSISEALTAEDGAEVTKMLVAANAQIAESNIFKSFGTSGAVTTTASEDAAVIAILKAEPTLSREQALAKAYETNPALLIDAMTQEG